MNLSSVPLSNNIIDLRPEPEEFPFSLLDAAIVSPTIHNHPIVAALMIGGCIAISSIIIYIAFLAGKE